MLLGSAPLAEAAVPFKVIAHPTVAGKTIKREVLGNIFLKKVIRWGDGGAITPVDLSLTSPVRLSFVETIMGLSRDSLQLYWGNQLTRGNVPPVTKKSEEDVVAFVASSAGAIGYVSADTSVTDAVKVLEVQ